MGSGRSPSAMSEDPVVRAVLDAAIDTTGASAGWALAVVGTRLQAVPSAASPAGMRWSAPMCRSGSAPRGTSPRRAIRWRCPARRATSAWPTVRRAHRDAAGERVVRALSRRCRRGGGDRARRRRRRDVRLRRRRGRDRARPGRRRGVGLGASGVGARAGCTGGPPRPARHGPTRPGTRAWRRPSTRCCRVADPQGPSAPALPAYALESVLVRVDDVEPFGGVTPEWAWGGSDGSGVRVAVIDSGVDADHPLLGGRVVDPGRGRGRRCRGDVDRRGLRRRRLRSRHGVRRDRALDRAGGVDRVGQGARPRAERQGGRLPPRPAVGGGAGVRDRQPVAGHEPPRMGAAVLRGVRRGLLPRLARRHRRQQRAALELPVAVRLGDQRRLQPRHRPDALPPQPASRRPSSSPAGSTSTSPGAAAPGCGSPATPTRRRTSARIAALVRSKHPWMRPHQVKAVLSATAANVRGAIPAEPAGRFSSSLHARATGSTLGSGFGSTLG